MQISSALILSPHLKAKILKQTGWFYEGFYFFFQSTFSCSAEGSVSLRHSPGPLRGVTRITGTSQTLSSWHEGANVFEFGVIKHGWQQVWKVLYWLSCHVIRDSVTLPYMVEWGRHTGQLGTRGCWWSCSHVSFHQYFLFRAANNQQNKSIQVVLLWITA